MRTNRFVAVCVLFGTLGIISAVLVQRSAGEEKTFFDRLDDFGRSIFDGILPPKKSKSEKTETYVPKDNADRRAGSVLEQRGQRSNERESSGAFEEEYAPTTTPPVMYQRGEDGTPRPVRRPSASTSLLEDAEPPVKSARQIPVENGWKEAKDQSASLGESLDPTKLGKPVTKPLHERLEDFSRSMFSSDKKQERRPQPDFQPERSSKTSPSGTTDAPRNTGRPVIAKRAAPAASARDYTTTVPVLVDDNGPNAKAEPESGRDRNKSSFEPARLDERRGVLFARKGPNLSIETFGPRTISVGRESSYEVHVINSGNVAAEELIVYVSLPEWAEVAGAEASTGAAGKPHLDRQTGTIEWKVGYLNAEGRERLALRIIPRQSRPFDFEVSWNYKPIASQALIEVQEPKLVMQLEGPQEVSYGKSELFHLRLANTGTGDAENVAITLMPVGTGENVQAKHAIPRLAAGEKKTLDVELTARQSGNLTVHVEARADGNLHAQASETVLVRRAGLEVALEGPKMQFVDTAANFAVAVVNSGNAPARNVKFSLALPSGVEYLSGIEGARLNAAGDKLIWTVDSLGVREELQFAVNCRLTAAGVSRVRLEAEAEDDLTTSAQTTVEVQAVANLTMDVKDPTGPVPVGEEAVYEVRVRNRGTKDANRVEVFAYFSNGIEPIAADGVPNRIGRGQVVFDPIDSLAPGAEVVLKVRARADAAGNHIFRAETHCKPLSARLISEATNLYYGDASSVEQTARNPSEPKPLR
ncbi:MAG: hypothetical protein JW959_12425 [Pirellulales bacterium]|nr:hypothetical protein [Pirellulales bacterium]